MNTRALALEGKLRLLRELHLELEDNGLATEGLLVHLGRLAQDLEEDLAHEAKRDFPEISY